ncbi:MAG: hypothetical protein IPK65_01220 [Gammaproteobacteria bacterium]|jgi:hypothetical protein|nr:hypothetical protein [Gammaproteobacteria bacterium]
MENSKPNDALLKELRAYTKLTARGEDVTLSQEAMELRKRMLAAYYDRWEGESIVDWLKRQPPGSKVTITKCSISEKE